MIKKLSTGFFLLLLILGNLSYAQSGGASTRIYSGYLHTKKQVDRDKTCSLAFKCPASNFHQVTVVVPEALTYSISFKQENVLGKFIIKVYANDGEEYLVDPNIEAQQAGRAGEHHLYDAYLIYLILNQGIHHFEIISVSGTNPEKYVLDKLEINEDHL
jgi:hypothetical protein